MTATKAATGALAPVRTRKQKALDTRRRMLAAAYRVFCARGYAGTTMEAIAEEAGVAVQTLYFTFHTKGAVLSETVGAAILGFDRWDPRAEPMTTSDPRAAFEEFHDWFPAFARAPTQARALAVFIDASIDILARVGPLVAVMTAAAASDPDVSAVADLGEQRRVEGYGLVIDQLAKKGGLRERVGRKRATDVLLTIVSAEVYQQLTALRGWSRSRVRAWWLEVLSRELLPADQG